MLRKVLPVFLIIFPSIAWTQVRLTKLVLRPKQVYELKQTDILVVDSLIMMDSSRLILNKYKQQNFIHARVIKFGKGCWIDGEGGEPGARGAAGLSALGNSKLDGYLGRKGERGKNGIAGKTGAINFQDK